MIAHPEKQKKCQEELDTIVGRSRMPTFEDRDNLPYLRATVRELLRWRPVAPIGRFFKIFESWYCSTHISVRYTACYKGGKLVLFVEYIILTLPRTIGIEVISSLRAPCVLPTFGTFFSMIPWKMFLVNDSLNRLLNRDQNIYVCCILFCSFAYCYPLTLQGPDANDFNPDRFIDEHGELSPALIDTKDGMLLNCK